MFARRKRRPQNEEPLVPHGLVGQAIEHSPATLAVVTRNPEPRPVASEEVSAKTQSELRPLLSLVQPAKEPTTQAPHPASPSLVHSRSNSTHPDLSVAQPLLQSAVQVNPRLVGSRMIDRAQKHIVEVSTRTRGFLAGNWRRSVRFISDGAATLGEVAQRARKNVKSLELRKHVNHVQRLVAVSARSIASQSRMWISKFNLAVAHPARKTSSSPAAPSGTSSLSDNQERKFSERYRVRISLSGVPLHARLWLARAAAKWKLRSAPISRDSRLWTPLAMGMLAALLVMALFSATGYYAKSALPSNHVAPAASAPTPVSVMPASVALQLAATKHTDARGKSPKQPSVRQKPRVTSISKPKHRNNEDEDYVAADTYVYYGNAGTKRR